MVAPGLAVFVTVATSVTRTHLGSFGPAASRAQHALAPTSGPDTALRIGSLIAFVAFILAPTVNRGSVGVPAVAETVTPDNCRGSCRPPLRIAVARRPRSRGSDLPHRLGQELTQSFIVFGAPDGQPEVSLVVIELVRDILHVHQIILDEAVGQTLNLWSSHAQPDQQEVSATRKHPVHHAKFLETCDKSSPILRTRARYDASRGPRCLRMISRKFSASELTFQIDVSDRKRLLDCGVRRVDESESQALARRDTCSGFSR